MSLTQNCALFPGFVWFIVFELFHNWQQSKPFVSMDMQINSVWWRDLFFCTEKLCMGSSENSFQYSQSINVYVPQILFSIECNVTILFSFEMNPFTLEIVEKRGFVLLVLVKLCFPFGLFICFAVSLCHAYHCYQESCYVV